MLKLDERDIPSPLDAAEAVTCCTEEELAEFMEVHQPAKAKNAARIMETFAGRDVTLLQMLYRKYGDVPPLIDQRDRPKDQLEALWARKRELLEAATSTMHAPSWAYVNQLLRKAHESLDVDTIQQLAAVNQKLIDALVESNNPAQEAIVEHLQTFLAREDVQTVLDARLVPMGREIEINFPDANLGLGLTGGLNQTSQSAFSCVVKDFPRRLSGGRAGAAEKYNSKAPPHKQLVPGMIVVKVGDKSVEGLRVTEVVELIKQMAPPRSITFDHLSTVEAAKCWAEEKELQAEEAAASSPEKEDEDVDTPEVGSSEPNEGEDEEEDRAAVGGGGEAAAEDEEQRGQEEARAGLQNVKSAKEREKQFFARLKEQQRAEAEAEAEAGREEDEEGADAAAKAEADAADRARDRQRQLRSYSKAGGIKKKAGVQREAGV